jgi:hypothetical protein
MQSRFSEPKYAAKKKVTRRDRRFGEIEAVTPSTELVAVPEPFYPKGETLRRSRIALTRLLRPYIAHQLGGLHKEGMVLEAYGKQVIRQFLGIELHGNAAPDATTLLNFSVRARDAASGQRRVRYQQRPFRPEGIAIQGGRHCARHDHRCDHFHHAPSWRMRPVHAPDNEAKRMVTVAWVNPMRIRSCSAANFLQRPCVSAPHRQD